MCIHNFQIQSAAAASEERFAAAAGMMSSVASQSNIACMLAFAYAASKNTALPPMPKTKDINQAYISGSDTVSSSFLYNSAYTCTDARITVRDVYATLALAPRRRRRRLCLLRRSRLSPHRSRQRSRRYV